MRVLVALFFAATLAATLALAGSVVPTVSLCAKPGALLSNVKWVIDPPSIVPGKNVTVKLSGDLSQEVSAGTIKLDAVFDGLPVLHQTQNLCHIAAKAGEKCPFAKGPLRLDVTHNVPQIPSILHGEVKLTATVTSEPSGQQITCIEVKADL